MTIQEIFYYATILLSIIMSIVVSVFSVKRKKKTDPNCEIAVENVENNGENNNKSYAEVILNNIPKYMIAAENLYNNIVNPSIKKTGAQKLAYVLDKVKIDCLTNNVEYNEQVITNKVEELIDLTKEVNSNKN